ncbi:hypothetical protein [Vibrio ostreae]|uniref:Uncharacterized protein n=1 Tax=Vibrio ostreae TaxID=2841925 RepID=A0A975YMA7_9VIBR|nr:hypothetical protein [Vibrio ostreae]QXO16230.1 hypothetical protein KNV97_01540 [Vibrio ostreae]
MKSTSNRFHEGPYQTEKGETSIPKNVDATMRQLFLESIDEDSNLGLLLQKLAVAEAEVMMTDIVLEERDNHWLKAC